MLSVLSAAMLAAQTGPVLQQPVVPPAVEVAPVAPCCLVKALTPIRLSIVNPIASNEARSGDRFAIVLREPILLDGGRSIPAGTPGEGEVVHAARTGLAGKPGELLLAARFLDFQGIRIPLRSMRVGGSGKDNVGLAMITYAAVGIVGLVISGGQVRIVGGAPADAKISTDTIIEASRLAPPAPVTVTTPAPLVVPIPAHPGTTNPTSEGNTQ